VPNLERTRQVGRSQAASIFWGLVSLFFTAAACYYFWKNHENETSADVLRDQVLTLQEQRDSLSSQRDKLQASISETETQLKTREDLIEEKETKLAEEETQAEAIAQQAQANTLQNEAETALIKKFNDTVRKLAQDDTDVVVREGRPVLRVPDSLLFAFGGTTLKPEGKALLNQIAQSISGQMGNFELRIATFTDSAESAGADGTTPTPVNLKPDPATTNAATATKPPLAPPPDRTPWDLTGARAAALEKYFHDDASLPFPNVIVVARGDFDPIVDSGADGHARNRRTEITIAPMPAPFHAPDANAAATTAKKDSGADKTDKKEKSTKSKKDKEKDKSDSHPN
jgi:flagellar motor protein MotB